MPLYLNNIQMNANHLLHLPVVSQTERVRIWQPTFEPNLQKFYFAKKNPEGLLSNDAS